jgi:hypothetical protein
MEQAPVKWITSGDGVMKHVRQMQHVTGISLMMLHFPNVHHFPDVATLPDVLHLTDVLHFTGTAVAPFP